MNRDLLFNPSKFLTTRAKQFAAMTNEALGSIKTTADALYKLFSSIRDFFMLMGKPTMKKRYVYDNSPPASSDINDTLKEVYDDIRLAADEQVMLGHALRQSFNYTTTEHLRLRNRTKRVGELVSDYIVTAKNTLSKCLLLQDSFTDLSKSDMSGLGNPAMVHTKSGIVTLQPTGTINRSPKAQVISVVAKPKEACPGNFLVVYKKDAVQDKVDQMQAGQTGQEWALYYDADPHADEASILDQNPDTWYEYQMINVPEEYKQPGATPDTKGYGWTWADGSPLYYGDRNKDSLNCIFTIQLEKPELINWIDLYPYFPDESCYLVVNEVATSIANANDYVTCLIDAGDRFAKINSNTQISDIDFKDRQKFRGHGVWVFPAREAQYIKIDVTAEHPYTCPIGHIYWEVEYDVVTHTTFLWIFHSDSSTHVKERIDGPKFNKDKVLAKKNYAIEGAALGAAIGLALPVLGPVLGAVAGFIVGLFSSSTTSVENVSEAKMGLDVYQDGFRWCVGVRSVDVHSNQYALTSTFMSKNFAVPKPIREISLSVSEMIPEEFYKDNLVTKNQWIKYYVSIDNGATWWPISPLERMPVDGEQDFPPKVIAVVAETQGTSVDNKSYIVSKEDANSIRLMAEFSRPEGQEYMTPVLYDYTLRLLPREAEE